MVFQVSKSMTILNTENPLNLLFNPRTMSDTTLRLAEKIAAVAPSLAKPLVVCWPVGNMARQAFHCLEKAGIPLFFHPSRCLSAVGHFVRYGIRRKNC